MTLKCIIIGAIIAILVVSPAINVYATSNADSRDAFRNITEEEREIWFSEKKRPAINPDFDPDQDCNIAYEIKCIPGSQQSCRDDLDGFHNGEDNVCSPIRCPEDHHTVEDDETGLCYPNEEGCPEFGDEYSNLVLLTDRSGGRDDYCAYLSSICGYSEQAKEDYCIEWKESLDN